MPQTKAQIAVEATIPMTCFRFSLGAQCTIASAAPGTPNIMHGKNPDMYIPSDHDTSAEVSPAQKCVMSPSPIVSNQKTLLSA